MNLIFPTTLHALHASVAEIDWVKPLFPYDIGELPTEEIRQYWFGDMEESSHIETPLEGRRLFSQPDLAGGVIVCSDGVTTCLALTQKCKYCYCYNVPTTQVIFGTKVIGANGNYPSLGLFFLHPYRMIIVGPRFESPSVLPNRTAAAIKDLRLLVASIPLGLTDGSLLHACISEFRNRSFSEIITPALFESPVDVCDLVFAALILSLRHVADPAKAKVLLCMLVVLVACVDQMNGAGRSGTREQVSPAACMAELHALLLRKPSVRDVQLNATQTAVSVTRVDLEKLTELVRVWNSEFLTQLVSALFPRFRLKHRLCMFIDHSGSVALRDNCGLSTARQLSLGEETGRAVQVVSCGVDDVGLAAREGEGSEEFVFFRTKAQTAHNPQLLRECKDLMQELANIIPAPLVSRPEALGLLPPNSVKMLLRNGRIVKRRRRG